MKQVYIHQEKGNKKLLLFFSGWASNEQLFEGYSIAEGYDCLLCYDYRDLTFDTRLMDGYTSVRVLAWSMGVWAATVVLGGMTLPFEMKVAVNGTPTPVHDTQGIPTVIYEGTITHLAPTTLRKFFRRMCGSNEQFRAFLERTTPPVIADLQEELIAIEKVSTIEPAQPLQWDKAIIGQKDLIFPTANQREAWSGATLIEERPIAHYDSDLFAACLSGKEAIWTKG